MTLRFMSLASGSSGNCYYVGTADYGVLVDAGIGLRTIRKALRQADIDFDRILAVLVTHDHGDHIKTVGCLGERCHIPVYATERVHTGINRSRYVDEPLHTAGRVIEKGVPFTIRDLTIEAFEIPHDSSDCVGYFITCGPHRLAIASDIGQPTDTIAHAMKNTIAQSRRSQRNILRRSRENQHRRAHCISLKRGRSFRRRR